jgi:hypothetical protein
MTPKPHQSGEESREKKKILDLVEGGGRSW